MLLLVYAIARFMLLLVRAIFKIICYPVLLSGDLSSPAVGLPFPFGLPFQSDYRSSWITVPVGLPFP
jgi:hypothetical protein